MKEKRKRSLNAKVVGYFSMKFDFVNLPQNLSLKKNVNISMIYKFIVSISTNL